MVIVSGETGSGKSTQIPKFCLAAGRGLDGMIGHTQPRRIAAVAVAQRIAEELGEPLGHAVGYKIRFSDRTARDAYIKIMTDGILLAETQTDRRLSAYDTIIVDEAHERNLNIDFILGYLKRLVERRRDLKVVITSATIDTEKFSRAFGGAPVIDVTGRTFPVEVRYADPGTVAGDNGEVSHVELAVQAVAEIARERRGGDVLVFMPTEQDIRDACEALEGRVGRHAVILPLFARLTAADQARVFKPAGRRKIIVATNVAETSITIPGIRYVVDTGLRPDLALLPAHADHRAAGGADLAQQRGPAQGTLRPRGARGVHPSVRGGGLPGAAAVHRPRDPARQSGRGHPAHDRARPRGRGRFPVHRPAGAEEHPRRLQPAHRAGGHRGRRNWEGEGGRRKAEGGRGRGEEMKGCG